MKLIMESIIYIVIILFAILLNLFFIAYKKNINKKESKAFLDVSLLLSMYFSLYFYKYLDNDNFIIFSSITIFLSLVYKREIIANIVCFMFFQAIINSFDINLLLFYTMYFTYIVLYLLYLSAKLSKNFLIIILELVTIMYFILEVNIENDYLILLIYGISCYLAYYLLLKSKEVIKIFTTFKDVEKESFIKLSLFKITHEIKNPLAVVKGYLDMFNADNKEKSIKYIGIIKNEIKRTLNLLSDLNDFNKIKLNKSEINFSKLLDELKDIFVCYFNENKIECSFRTEDNIIINGDPERLKQVLINMIKNAIEASYPGNKIFFTSYSSREHLYILIEDTGTGMSQETLENLFVPFYTTKEMGTGLGLCLSKEIVEAHKGSMFYTSVLGKGTIVKIVLPFH